MYSGTNVGTITRVPPAQTSPEHSARLPRGFVPAVAVAASLIVIRAFVWIFFEQSGFDSDQAVVGLMAKHLAEGRAFPLFYYGQHYMLAVEPWLAAPLFKVFGASVATLKLPLMAINIATA